MSPQQRPSIRRASTTPVLDSNTDESRTNETSPLLTRRTSEHERRTTRRATALTTESSGTTTMTSTRNNKHKLARLRWALAQALDHGSNYYTFNSATPNLPEKSSFEDLPAYDQFTSIDWIRDTVMMPNRVKHLSVRTGGLRSLLVWADDVQGWVLAALVGFVTAVLAYLIDVMETKLFQVKFGYCKGNVLLLSPEVCCVGPDSCKEWIDWSSLEPFAGLDLGFAMYLAVMLALSLASCFLVLSHQRAVAFSVDARDASQEQPRRQPAAIYPASGSGVAEVKVIASGFIIHGFLGIQTLVVKAFACTMSVASGLSIGKEGPYVHMAACLGNILAKLFPEYRRNSGSRREIISAASAAGVAVAFGAPISGVLFSLEEVAYYFPSKTLLRTFLCSTVAAVSLKFLDPYGTSKIVLFQVQYRTDWRAAEMIFFILLGILGGGLGALFVKCTRLWAKTFRQIPVIKQSPMLDVALVAIITAALSYWNPGSHYTTLPVATLMFELASDCHGFEQTGTGLCPDQDEIPDLLIALAFAFIIKALLTTIAFGLKVPAGIYVPSMVVGGLLGRAVAHALQYALMKGPTNGIWGNCAIDARPESCLVPGVYALLTAGAVMVGVTRLTITVVVMLFELSGSLDHVLPFAIAVMTAKWTADFIEPLSIYDLLMETNDYPFLDSKTRPILTGELGEVIPLSRNERYIDISDSVVVGSLELAEKLQHMLNTGQADGGLPIIKDGILLGIISCPELAYTFDSVDVLDNVPCLVAPRGRLPDRGDEEYEDDVTDLTKIIDSAPLSLDVHSPIVLAYECFVKLGVRYIPVLRDGYYVGLIHKKAFLKHIRSLKHPA